MGFRNRTIEWIVLGIIGGTLYVCIELLYRGYSHISMWILGAIVFVLMGSINEYLSWDTALWKQCLIATVIITVLEFFTGLLVNKVLHWNVWDYSNVWGNILGQICVPYMCLWYFLSCIGIVLDDFIRWKLLKEEKPKYKVW